MYAMQIQSEVPSGLGGIIRALTAGVHSTETRKVAARGAANLTRKHLYGLANTRHRSHVAHNFYEDAADAVSGRPLSDGVEVSIDKVGMAQRYFGGKIEAVNVSYLTIPIAERAEGRTAREFDDLIPIISALTHTGVLVDKASGDALFALVQSVEQDPDPSVLPTNEEYQAAVAEAVDALLDTLLRRNVETSWSASGESGSGAAGGSGGSGGGGRARDEHGRFIG